jgi:hypothetical protein
MVDGVTERTGGVPLFVEEVTRLLLERGEVWPAASPLFIPMLKPLTDASFLIISSRNPTNS